MARRAASSLLLILVAFAILFGRFFLGLGAWLWGREHYQYFPLVIAGAGVLAWWRLRGFRNTYTSALTYRTWFLAVVALVTFAIAAVFRSNWLGSISGWIAGWAIVWQFGGKDLVDRIRSSYSLLLLILPLPLNLDLKLIIALQKTATIQASRFLDFIGILHSVSGVSISTADRSFLVEEACSGIHSLFSCLCAVAFYCSISGYGLTRTIANLVQGMGWVIFANTLRVIVIIFAYQEWTLSLDTGISHDLLGVCTYAIGLLLAISTDRLIRFLVPLKTEKLPTARSIPSGIESTIQRVSLIRRRFISRLDKPRTISQATAKVALFLATLLVGSVVVLSVSRNRPLPRSSEAGDGAKDFIASMRNLEDNVLPENVPGWERISVERVSRSADDPQGTHSTIFHFRGRGLAASFSIDGYYKEWHDLAYCYNGLGWHLSRQMNAIDPKTGFHVTALSLYGDDGSYSESSFSCFDSSLRSVPPGDATLGTIETFRLLWKKLNTFAQSSDSGVDFIPPVIQFQLICTTPGELLDEEKKELRELFATLSVAALSSLRGERQ